jgi:hypothetical protein
MPRPVAITLSMVGCLLAYAACTQLANAAASASVEHGRYLVRIAGCNDCHTDGYHMSKLDLSAIYHFIRYLGPAGVSAPAFVPPDQQPKGPVVQFTAPPPATNKSR